jgi:CCR4-NOT transcriptional regulation complex NOT5 subunit
MDQKLKEELLAFFTNVERTMKAYNFSLTSREYIDPYSHTKNIENINRLCSELKKKVEKL